MQDPIQVVSTPSFDLSYYSNSIISFFTSHTSQIVSGGASVFSHILGYLIGLSIIVSIMLLFGIIYCVERLKYIRKQEALVYDAKVDMGYETNVKKTDSDMEYKWSRVKQHIGSTNENDWKQAIIEADIMLGEMLTKLGYKGEGIGEQLKRVAKGDFKNIDKAWEAHKIRNIIAHEGSSFSLSHSDANRVINQYKQVFQEFYLINE